MKNFSAGFLLLALLLLPAVAQNLVTNPGFETGDTSGWFNFGSPTLTAVTSPVHSGTYSALVTNRTATYMGIAQTFQSVLQTNVTYNVSAWLRLVSGINQTVQITAQKTDAGGPSYTAIASGVVSNGGWAQLSGQYSFAVNGTLTNLNIYFEMPSSTNAAYYIDDVSISASTYSTNGQTWVDAGNVHQRIDGFGASSAWNSSWSVTQANMFFSTNTSGGGTSFDGKTNFNFNSIGLSLLRSRIAPGGTTVESAIMQYAQARGARVWSTPWSPAAAFKSNGNVNGGSLVGNAANYQAYANQLAGYVVNMKNTYGVNLYAVSVQNEPDAQVATYESCNWTAQQIHDFVPYLSGALAASNVPSTKIMLPESQNWQDYSNLTGTAMADPATSNLVSIVADHNYDGANGPSSLAKNTYGKALWETEVSLFTTNDSSITNGVYFAGRIHQFMTQAQVNAWHFWWLTALGGIDNESLTDSNGVPTKRMYALGQFSRFVRPNFYRVDADTTGDAEISAYKDSSSLNFAVVAVNPDPNAITQVFNLNNFATVSQVTPWMTTSNLSLAQQAVVILTNQSFIYTLPAMSIVTFAGAGLSNTPPVFNAIAKQTTSAGLYFTVTNLAVDTDSPPQQLSYSLLSGPTNAALDSQTAVLSWRPTVAQANTSNNVIISVTDSGNPPLTTTDTFAVLVNPVTNPIADTATYSSNRFNLTVNGPFGPDYTLLFSSNLTTWQPLLINNQPILPFIFTDTNTPGSAARFYRLKLGP